MDGQLHERHARLDGQLAMGRRGLFELQFVAEPIGRESGG